MNDGINSLDRALEVYEKQIDESYLLPYGNTLLARQDLESALVVLSDRLTPIRDRTNRIKGEGTAHLWNIRTSLDTLSQGPLGLINIFYAKLNRVLNHWRSKILFDKGKPEIGNPYQAYYISLNI